MDRSDQHRTFDHDMGQATRHRGGYYRQGLERHGSYREDDTSPEWGYIATGAVMLALGGYLLYQGTRGRPIALPSLGRGEGQDRQEAPGAGQGMLQGSRGGPGVQVREQVTVNRPVAELYRFWRNVENLPRVMTYLDTVTEMDDRRSHWVAKGPAGQKIEWDAEVTDARENEVVAWRSLEGSEIPNEGSVRFSRSPDGKGTVIDVVLTYHPPGGKAGAAIAKLFGREPAQEIRHDLDRFKERVESGNLILGSGSQGGISGAR